MLTEDQILDFAARASRLSHRVLTTVWPDGCIPRHEFRSGLVVVPTGNDNNHNYPPGMPAISPRDGDNCNYQMLRIDGMVGNCLNRRVSCLRPATVAEASQIIRILIRVEPESADSIYAKLAADANLAEPRAVEKDPIVELAARAVAFTRKHFTATASPRATRLRELIHAVDPAYVSHGTLTRIVSAISGEDLTNTASVIRFRVGMILVPTPELDARYAARVDPVHAGCGRVNAIDQDGDPVFAGGYVPAHMCDRFRPATVEEATALFRRQHNYSD